MTASIDRETVEARLDNQAKAQIDRQDVVSLLQGLADHLGLDGLDLDQNGTLAIAIDDDVEVSLNHQASQPYLIALAPMPDQPGSRGMLLRKLLSSNLNYALTHGGTFAMVPETGALVLCRQIDIADCDVAHLDVELARFVELVEAWQGEIGDYLENVADEVDEAPFSGPQLDQFV